MVHLVDKAKDFVAEKVAHIKKSEADVSEVSIKHVSPDSATFNRRLSITNPYSHDLPIGEVSYALHSAGEVIASGNMMDPWSITDNQTTDLDIPIKTPQNILSSLEKDVGSDWDIDYMLQLGLGMHLPVLGKFILPRSKKEELKLPTVSDIF